MVDAADARGGIGIFLGVFFGILDQLLHAFPGAVGPHVKAHRFDHKPNDGDKIVDGVVGQALKRDRDVKKNGGRGEGGAKKEVDTPFGGLYT